MIRLRRGERGAPVSIPAPDEARGLDEVEDGLAERLPVRTVDAVRRPGKDLQRPLLDELDGLLSGLGDRHDLVVAAMGDEHGHLDCLQIPGLSGLGERFDTVVGQPG